jgi:hypothetical protein
MTQDNLTAKQKDYAVFLPAISGFYATFIGKQRSGTPYVEQSRMPANLQDMENFNWLNAQKGVFPYKWSLYSGGHANLDLTKQDWSEDMVRNRDPNTILLGDSGGFQIAKGLWEGEWRDPNSPAVQAKLAELAALGTTETVNAKGKKVIVNPLADYQKLLANAQKKREAVLKWLDGIANYGMTLDIPTWVVHDEFASKMCGITTHQEAVDATKFNNEYFINNRKGVKNGGTKFLNVLQGANHADADDWYETMKVYCDPKAYPDTHFDGWGMGGQNMCDVHLILKRIVTLINDGLLEPGKHDWMHFLGTSRLEWALVLTDIQRAVRQHHNPNFTISFDCASPFLATANGQIYYNTDIAHGDKWVYRMNPSVDDKKYATDTRTFRDAVIQDGIFDVFDSSPIIDNLLIKDVCYYKPGDLNKIGKEGKTSWDSFSYALQMGHNVWMHINAVQEANRQYDAGSVPGMLADPFGHFNFRDLVNEVFAQKDFASRMAKIDYYHDFWMKIKGTRGFTGKKALNTHSNFNDLFTFNDTETVDLEDGESIQLDIDALDQLETQQEK